MRLWTYWWNAIWLLRPGCSRLRTFLWFATCVAGLTVRDIRIRLHNTRYWLERWVTPQGVSLIGKLPQRLWRPL